MAVTTTPAYLQTIINKVVTIVNADSTNLKTVYVAGANGSRFTSLLVTSDDSSNRDLKIYWTISGTDYLLGIVQIPLTAGTVNTVPTVNLFNSTNFPGLSVDSNGNRYMDLASGTTLKVAAGSAVTTAKTITVAGYGADL